ncbi:MAG: amidohydrolase [Lachnospiraceae bacterium]|nr:amidohydrolase [Lachnospiraceae bacterium]
MGITKNEALLAIDRDRELFCKTSDLIWENPETAFLEHKSMEILCELLEKEGFEVTKNIANIPTAFTGTYGHGKPVIGFLGEFDALSGLSQVAGCAERKELISGAAGHGCGHNLLGVGSIAAAVAMKEYLENNNKEGTVVFFGCPGEEGGSGKAFMAREGAFDDVDFAISWHPQATNEVWVGSTLANYQISYRFHGISSHAASAPEKGRSAYDAVELMNVGVQYLREHVIQEARIHCAVTNTGGFSPNVVQPYAEVLYLIRAPKNDQVKEIYERINDIARGAALMTSTKMELEFIKACSNLVDNTVLQEVMYKNALEIEREPYTEEDYRFAAEIKASYGNVKLDIQDRMKHYEKRSRAAAEAVMAPFVDADIYDFIIPLADVENCLSASTDVGDVSYVCPTVQFKGMTEAAGTRAHSWQRTAQGKSPIAYKGMLFTAKVMAGTAIDMVENPEKIEAAKKELETRLGGKKYECPIPKDVVPQAIKPKK